MIEIQNIPIPLTADQKIVSSRIKAMLKRKRLPSVMAGIDYSSIELRALEMCDPIYALRRLTKKRTSNRGKTAKSHKELRAVYAFRNCHCPKLLLVRHGCKCGGK